MQQTTFIYSLSCPISGEVRYIGKSNNLRKRANDHSHYGKTGIMNHRRTWISYLKNKGLKPIIELVDEVNLSEWQFWEKYYISLFKTWGFNLVNTKEGGNGLGSHSEKVRKNLSGVNNPMFGKKRLDVLKINTSRIGKTLEEIHGVEKASLIKSKMGRKGELSVFSKPILQHDLNGNFVKEYASGSIACQEVFGSDKSSSSITRCARGEGKTGYGFIWKYKKID